MDYAAKLIAYLRTKECSEKYISNKIISQDEIEVLLTELHELANNKSTLVSGVSMIQIWGSVS